MYEDDEDRIDAADQLAEHNPQTAAEADRKQRRRWADPDDGRRTDRA